MLTERQKAACREYLIDFNWTAAMQRAGYTKTTANKTGWELFRNPDVAFYLKQLIEKQQSKQELTADMVLEEMRRLGLSNIADYYKWSEKKKKYVLKPLSELTRAQTAAIAKYEPGEGYTLYNKDSALDKLGRYFKMYTEIGTVVQNYVMMPTVKIGGKEHIFQVGKPKKPNT